MEEQEQESQLYCVSSTARLKPKKVHSMPAVEIFKKLIEHFEGLFQNY
jgi:hypothetical protein